MALRKLLTAQFLLLLTTTASLAADWRQWLGAVEGGRVYAFTSDGDGACFDAASGKVRWKKSVRAQLGGKPGQWAYSESPLLDGNAVIVDPGGTDATRLAVDKWNGKVIWKSAVPGGEDAASRQPSSSTAVAQTIRAVPRQCRGWCRCEDRQVFSGALTGQQRPPPTFSLASPRTTSFTPPPAASPPAVWFV